MSNDNLSPLIPLGVGVAIGGSVLWIAIKIWPAVILGGAAWLIAKGVGKSNPTKVGTE